MQTRLVESSGYNDFAGIGVRPVFKWELKGAMRKTRLYGVVAHHRRMS